LREEKQVESLSVKQIERFLREVDRTFPIPLSQKQDLRELARKFHERASICAEASGERILAMVAGYTANVPEDKAYISVVATVPDARGRGLAKRLVQDFIGCAKAAGLSSVHLYCDRSNRIAERMYRSLGFLDLVLENEPRPLDIHLIYHIERGNE
jgi:ribosomal protein S18 acetylase RimI-like enzyme